ncbi:hypothetical protein D3C75_1335070 [compost metagenome]
MLLEHFAEIIRIRVADSNSDIMQGGLCVQQQLAGLIHADLNHILGRAGLKPHPEKS